MVGAIRNQDAHIHAAQYSQAQRGEHGLVGNEVGAGDPYAASRGVDGFDEKQ
ncbi:hypothetical protein D3C76_1553270 [compost metagenome]